ncbi:MAG: hypothetical protein FWG50_13415, partial [Kiritimatiellaeota bacterium]|nr:hypothetical protein [Kiritimatiellota bacterium]
MIAQLFKPAAGFDQGRALFNKPSGGMSRRLFDDGWSRHPMRRARPFCVALRTVPEWLGGKYPAQFFDWLAAVTDPFPPAAYLWDQPGFPFGEGYEVT